MKKYIIILNLIFTVCIGRTEIIPLAILETVAKNYLQLQNSSRTYTISGVYREGLTSMQIASEENALINLVSFSGGGWVLLSNDFNATPILGYSEQDFFNYDTNDMPGGLILLLENYKEEILWIRNNISKYTIQSEQDTFFVNNRQKWTDLQNPNSAGAQKIQNFATTAKNLNTLNLLDDPSKGGNPLWGQDKNNWNTCTPAYNASFPGKEVWIGGCIGITGSKCDCDRKPSGCASVAMAQLMRYWKFPPQYDWDQIPNTLSPSTNTRQAENIAHLRRKCGDAVNTTYCCLGSYTTTNKIERAFHDSQFSYPTAEKKTKKDRDDKQWWPLLIKGEINEGRPVIYRGDKCDFCGEKHFWIVSGYNGEDLFYCNWGWRGTKNGHYNLLDLKQNGDDFRKNNMIILNIKPNWNATNDPYLVNISQAAGSDLRIFGRDVTMSKVALNSGSYGKIYSTNAITVNELTVEGGAELTLICSDSNTTPNAPLSYPANNQTTFINHNDGRTMELSPEDDFQLKSNNGEFCIYMGANWADNVQKDVCIYDLEGALVLQTNFIGKKCVVSDLHKKGEYLVAIYTPIITLKKQFIFD